MGTTGLCLASAVGCIMVPKGIQVLLPGTCDCYFIWEKKSAYVIKLRIWRCEDDSRLSRWTINTITIVLIQGRQREICHRRGESGSATSQGCQQSPAAGRGRGTDSPLEPRKGEPPGHHLDLGSVELISDFWGRINSCCFKLVVICNSSQRKCISTIGCPLGSPPTGTLQFYFFFLTAKKMCV